MDIVGRPLQVGECKRRAFGLIAIIAVNILLILFKYIARKCSASISITSHSFNHKNVLALFFGLVKSVTK